MFKGCRLLGKKMANLLQKKENKESDIRMKTML